MIPNEAVEAAAEAMWLARPMQRTTDGGPLPFAEAKGYERRRHLDQARHALTAAAPFIAAQALSEAADQFHARLPDGTGNGRAYNSHQVALILREQSESVRGKA